MQKPRRGVVEKLSTFREYGWGGGLLVLIRGAMADYRGVCFAVSGSAVCARSEWAVSQYLYDCGETREVGRADL